MENMTSGAAPQPEEIREERTCILIFYQLGETGVEPTHFFHMAIKSVSGMLARIFQFM